MRDSLTIMRVLMLVILAMGKGLKSREENLGMLIEAGYKQWGVIWGECR